MVVERRENDKQIEEVRDQANQVEAKVRTNSKSITDSELTFSRQMNEHLKKSEIELNELLAEYWKLRRETGTFPSLPLVECITTSTLTIDIYMETLANKLDMRVISE